MMQRRHFKDPFLAEFVTADLQDDGQRLDDEDAADKQQQYFLLDENGKRSEAAAECKRPDVAHEDLRRMRVVPKKTDGSARHRCAENGQLGRANQMGESKIPGEAGVPRDVRQDGHRARGDDHEADGEAVQPIGQVDSI